MVFMRRGAMAAALAVGLMLLSNCTGSGSETPARSSDEPVSTTALPLPSTTAPPKAKANIVLVLTDDLDARSIEFMPKLKSLLAERGTTFSNYLVNVSLCCPSRTSMLRGQYAHTTGIFGNQPPAGGFEAVYAKKLEDSTIATWLHDAGYRTALIGKYLNGYPQRAASTYVPPGWDEWDSPSKGVPYSEFNYTLNENGTLVSYGAAPEDYLGDVIAAKAGAFIRQASADRKPFFLYLPTYAPHGPATPAPRHQDLFPEAKALRNPSFNEEDVSDKPAWVRALPSLTPARVRQIDDLYRKRLQSLQAVDEMLAGLVQTLQETGSLDNTYLVFSSDNGFHLGQHRQMSGKQAPYEEDIRVPLIVRGPGVPAGRTVDHLSGNIDLAPTFAEWAGVQAPDTVDGRSLAPLLRTDPPPVAAWRDAFLLEHGAPEVVDGSDVSGVNEPADPSTSPAGNRGIPQFNGIRTRTHTYVEYSTGERELYDLTADPHQLQNSVQSADPALVRSLADRLHQLARCSGAACQVR